jgi:DNA-binding transcriptional MocR family regulator
MNHKWTTINSKAVTSVEEIVAVLLENRNIVDSKDFFNPAHPATISLTTVGISEKEIKKAVKRIRQAIESREPGSCTKC